MDFGRKKKKKIFANLFFSFFSFELDFKPHSFNFSILIKSNLGPWIGSVLPGRMSIQNDSDEKDQDQTIPAEILLPQEILTQFKVVNVAAPMVRYSKLPFRQLVSLYDTHITHTPMMLAKEFSRSSISRDSDFTTNSKERGEFWMEEKNGNSSGITQEWDHSNEKRSVDSSRNKKRKVRGNLIVQFAANDPVQLADAAELIKPFVDGIDLNCGWWVPLSRYTSIIGSSANWFGLKLCSPQKWAFQEGIGCALLRNPNTVRDLVRTTKQRIGWDFPVSVKIRIDSDLT